MVLAKLLSGRPKKTKLQFGQRVAVAQLDQWLDVRTDAFAGASERLAREFERQQATLDVESHRTIRQQAAESAASPDFPDVRDPLYQADLRRLPPMEREEEFRMARRHEFLAALVRRGLERFGIAAADAAELVQQPARQIQLALEGRTPPRGLDRRWFEAMVLQLHDLRNLYVEGALYLVLSTVNRYRGLGVDTADLIQEGNASLFQAIDGFDWRRDVRFRTYAQFWVHQAVLKMLYNGSRTVRVPIWVQKVLGKIRRAQEEGRRAGVELSPAEIGARIGVPAERVEWVLATRRFAVSLDAEVGGDDGASLVQLLPDDSQPSVPDSVPEGDLRQALAEVMADLPAREQRILQRRFGLDGEDPQTLGQIATELGITAERVRQLQNAAIGRMKRPAKLQQLQAFVE
jgi:RNA polymerase sigma factor (sigma-70 family)